MLELNFDLLDFKKKFLFKSPTIIRNVFKSNQQYLKEFYRILLNPALASHDDLIRLYSQGNIVEQSVWSHSFENDSGIYRDISAITEAIKLKCSIVFDQYYKYSENAKELIAFTQEIFNCSSGCNAYLSQKDGFAYPIHRDTHDVLIFSISGMKKWCIFNKKQIQHHARNRVEHEIREEDILTEGICINEIVYPGDVVYIPAGQYHCVENLMDDSLHITVSMVFKSLVSMLDDVVNVALQPSIENKLSIQAINILTEIHPSHTNTSPLTANDLQELISKLYQLMLELIKIEEFVTIQNKIQKNNHLQVLLNPTNDFIDEIITCRES